MIRQYSTEIIRPLSNTERCHMLLMGMIGADEPLDDDFDDGYEDHMEFETRKEIFV